MPRLTKLAATAAALISALALAPLSGAAVRGKADLAALQTALMSRQLYLGPVDGIAGPDTSSAIRAFQRRRGLTPTGRLDRPTRRALGSWARPELGQRPLRLGMKGWDVAELQFQLAWHGFPSGFFTGAFNQHVQAALIRFQRWANLTPDGVLGRSTLHALHGPIAACPIRLAWPLTAPISSPFGPRGFGFHSGIDLAAPTGTPVAAAAAGRVSWAGVLPGGWGNLVIVDGAAGTQALYAHLSQIEASVGERVGVGAPIGRVGATGDARGPHLHFEVRLRGAAVDPLPALGH
jgi:peptidoglycan hydrolase-like protein with peptidoglycan-binding domain